MKLTHSQDRNSFYNDNVKSFQPQVEWLKDDEGTIAINFVARFETLHADFDQIRDAIGTGADLPHLNASSRRSYKDYYSDETREIIARWYREDIEVFAYTFD